MDLAKRWPLRLVAVPALDHEVEDLLRAVGRLREPDVLLVVVVVVAAVVDHLLVSERVERLLPSKGKHFPQGHRKRPDIALCRELPLLEKVTVRRGRLRKSSVEKSSYMSFIILSKLHITYHFSLSLTIAICQ